MKPLKMRMGKTAEILVILCVISALVATAMPTVFAKFTDSGYTAADVENNTLALIEGQGYKMIEDFSAETTGNKQLVMDNGQAGGHKSFTITSDTALKGGAEADYIQFDIDNPSNKDAELFFLKIQAPAAGNYAVSLVAGKPYKYYDTATSTWSDMTVAEKGTYYETPCIKVPAKTHGIVRIPMATLSGGNPGNDAYIFRDNLATIFDMYAHIPDPDGKYTLTFDNIAYISDAVPTGYDANPSYNAGLSTGLGAKLIDDCNALEDGKISMQITQGNAGGHKSATINPLSSPVGSSRADYLQFEVSNPSNKDAELFFLTMLTSAANYQLKLQKGGKYSFYDFETETWTESNVADSTTYYGDIASLRVPAGKNGLIRIPLSDLSGLNPDNDRYVIKADLITGFDIYSHIPDPDGPYTLTIDNICWIGGTPYIPADIGDEGDELDGYADTDAIKLNDGEVAQKLTGFEDDDNLPMMEGSKGQVTTDAHNNGTKSYDVTYSDGSWGGYNNFAIDVSTKSDWSQAKYVQFYVENTCPKTVGGAECNPLEIFYFEVDNSMTCRLTYGATGVKLYDMSTGKWSDIDVVENTFHLLPDKTKVPGIKVPAGFKGYVRVPLTALNFTNDITSVLSSVGRINMYSLIPGVPGAREVYYDDFYLISYTGDTAPVYQDDEVEGGETGGETGGATEDQPFTLTGVVTDANGSPIRNAQVTLSGSETFITNSDGQYKFENVSTGYIDLAVKGNNGIDYGFVAFSVYPGDTTAYDGANITIAKTSDGITVNLGATADGLSVLSVADGAIAGVLPGIAGNYDGTNTDGSINGVGGLDYIPTTGDAVNVAIVVLLFATSLSVFAYNRKKLFNQK